MIDEGETPKRPWELESWKNEIEFAQLLKWYTYFEPDGSAKYRLIERIPRGVPAQGDATAKCSDCKVAVGQLHVPGCQVELCPRCGGKATECNCPRVRTWHLLPKPDEEVAVLSPYTLQFAGTTKPLVSYANGCTQLDRFHIAREGKRYVVLIKPEVANEAQGDVYIPSPWIFSEALQALKELPPLPPTVSTE